MKKIYVLVVIICSSLSICAQTLFTYGNRSVSKDEFIRAYNKNKVPETDQSKALREYLDLYINFRLKVQAARDNRLDTLSSLKSELQNFRLQVEPQYLQDDIVVEELLNEAFDRSQKDIHISHIFIPVSVKPNLSDTAEALKAARFAYEKLTINRLALSTVVAELKRQNIQATYNDIGFITVFSIPYELEKVVYDLKAGAISKPYKTSKGYHIFQNIEERTAAGKMKVAQILLSVPSEPNKELRDAAFRKADSVHKLLLQGSDFSELARQVSTDQTTYMSGGILPEFGTGTYDDAFERRIVALKKDGDITIPFETPYGYHIVKRLSRTPVPPTKSDAVFMAELRQRLQADERNQIAKKKFLRDVLRKTGFKKNGSLKSAALWQFTDSFITSGKTKPVVGITDKTVLHSFAGSSIKVHDWLQFARDFKASPELYKGESYSQLMEKYVELTAFENYRKKLEDYNPAFKYQIQEFREGNMLFEIMERNIWSRAANDSIGLQKHYDKHRTKYLWKESADVIIVSAANIGIANQIKDQFQKGKNWKQIIEQFSSQVQSDSGRYEISQIPGYEKMKFEPGAASEPTVNAADGTAFFVSVIRLYPHDQQRNFEEARGLVINDYQSLLEDQWIDLLKKKYPVKVNEALFRSIAN